MVGQTGEVASPDPRLRDGDLVEHEEDYKECDIWGSWGDNDLEVPPPMEQFGDRIRDMGVAPTYFSAENLEALACMAAVNAAYLKLKLLIAVEASKLGLTYEQVGDLEVEMVEDPEPYDTREKIIKHIQKELKKVGKEETSDGPPADPGSGTWEATIVEPNLTGSDKSSSEWEPRSQSSQRIQADLKKLLERKKPQSLRVRCLKAQLKGRHGRDDSPGQNDPRWTVSTSETVSPSPEEMEPNNTNQRTPSPETVVPNTEGMGEQSAEKQHSSKSSEACRAMRNPDWKMPLPDGALDSLQNHMGKIGLPIDYLPDLTKEDTLRPY